MKISKNIFWQLTISLIVALILCCVAGLAITSATPELLNQYYSPLLFVNISIILLLFTWSGIMFFKLFRQYQEGQFGSRLTFRFSCILILFSLLPALILFIVSNNFISRSIESWFDVRVERALDSGVTITQNILSQLQNDALREANRLAKQLEYIPPSLLLSELIKVTGERGNIDALIFTDNQKAIAAASSSKLHLYLPSLPSYQQIQIARNTGFYTTTDGDLVASTENKQDPSLTIRVIVPIDRQHVPNTNTLLMTHPRENENLYLQLLVPVPRHITKNAAALLAGYRDYQELLLSRNSLKTLYTTVLSIALLIASFMAMIAAINFARRAMRPLAQLARGTKRVAEGMLHPIREYPGNDEINSLTSSFNHMIQELISTQNHLEVQRQTAEQAQAYLEQILSNISSGVIVCDDTFTIITSNISAHKIIGDSYCSVGSNLQEVLPALTDTIQNTKKKFTTHKTVSIELPLTLQEKEIPLYIRISRMPLGAFRGLVIVFDDMSSVLDAQRANAWAEVARRLAHEIKNPLTPIRLSAERLEYKLTPKLSRERDRAFLSRTIQMIVSQVDSLKNMVNEFREYARLPEAQRQPISIDDFLFEIVSLYRAGHVPVVFRPNALNTSILGDKEQIKRIFHNLLSNSMEAMRGQEQPNITISTKLMYTPHKTKPDALKIRLIDNGSGFDEKILQRAFEPYVTNKPTGTGLGLPMIKKIIDSHHASIQLGNRIDGITGAHIIMIFPIHQSSDDRAI